MLEKIFKLSENKTDVKTEILAGITTFMTMAYILAVNPSILSAAGMDSGAVFTATALAAFIGTLLMAALANYPFALAPGMGLNAYFAYTVVIGMGYSWEYALTAVFAEGIIFILLSVTNVREAIFNAIPKNLKSAVSVGIGLFIAFVGLQNAHIVMGGATLVELFSLDGYNQLNGVSATMNDIGITVILDHWNSCNQECERKYSLGYFDHMGNRYCLSVRRNLCSECRSWMLQPASGFQSRIIYSKYYTDFL